MSSSFEVKHRGLAAQINSEQKSHTFCYKYKCKKEKVVY